jgi:hypothetical protein
MTPHLKARLTKLLPLLASDKAGEVVATAAAIVRALEAETLDLHDLAAALGPTPRHARPTRGAFSAPPHFDDLTHFERRAWMDALMKAEWLTAFERDTVQEIRNGVLVGQSYNPHWRKKRRLNEIIARASAMGVRP